MRMRFFVVFVCLAVGLGKVAAQSPGATDWMGPFSIEVRVEDHRGRDLDGAEITLAWLDGSHGGPPAVRTGADGRARLAGLAPGRWELVARRDGQMTYVAEIVVTAEKPQIVTARHENVRGAIAPMRLRLTKGPVQLGSSPAMATRAQAEPERRSTPAPIRPANPPAAAPLVVPTTSPSASPAPSPTPRDVAGTAAAAPPGATDTPAKTTVARPPEPPSPPVPRAPALESKAPPVATPAPPRTLPAAPPPASAPPVTPGTAPAPAVAPTPVPAAPAPAAKGAEAAPSGAHSPSRPLEPPLLRRNADRTCPECPPGEASLSVEVVVDGAGTAEGCPPEAVSRFAAVAPDHWATGAEELPRPCAALLLDLPSGSRFTGYRYEAAAEGRYQDCPAGRDCPGLSCSWAGDPMVVRGAAGTRLAALFGNRAERPRRARFTAYFKEGKR